MEVLILGGSQFFGKELARQLLTSGESITLLNRGSADDGFGSQVRRIRCDRRDTDALVAAIGDRSWDVVYDQVCFEAWEALSACNVFAGRTRRLVFASAMGVYDYGADLREQCFQPERHAWQRPVTPGDDYHEAKRQCEAIFSAHATFELILARLPIVLGPNDPTHRLAFHLARIRSGVPLYVPNLDARISLIEAQDAARCLARLAVVKHEGAVNCAAPEPLSLRQVVEIMEAAVGREARITNRADEGELSPFGITHDRYMNVELASGLGLTCGSIARFLPILCRACLSQLPSSVAAPAAAKFV